LPEAAGIRVEGDAFEDDTRRAIQERTVYEIAVTCKEEIKL
jgi:hypothetical protein